MTLSTTDDDIAYTGDNSTTEFSYPYLFYDNSHLKVYADTVLQTITTDYTVTGAGNVNGGTVTFNSAPATDVDIVIERVVSLVQETDLENFDGNPSDVTEEQFDLIVMMAQQIQSQVDRAALVPIGTTLTTNVISGTINATNKLLALSTAGPSVQDVEASDLATLSGISADITAVADISANVTTVAGVSANVTTVAGISANVTTVAGISADVTTVAADGTDIGTVAGISADVTTVADNITDVQQAADTVEAAVQYTFSTTTAMADPGAGVLRYNNATASSVTAIAIDDTTAQTGNPDISAWIVSWDDSTNTNKGTLKITKASNPAVFAIYTVTALTDNAGWTELAVTYVTGAGSFSNADDLFISFSRAGDQGATSGGTLSSDLIPADNYIGRTKGGDIASASPLVIDTDGDYFDVTGTTSFAAMTVAANRNFTLQFDGALTITHGSGITLPGAANYTTSAGDILHCQSTAANTVVVTGITKADGTAVVGGGGAWEVIAHFTGSGQASANITGFDSATYDAHEVVGKISPDTGNQELRGRTSTDGGSTWDSGTADYNWHIVYGRGTATTVNGTINSGSFTYFGVPVGLGATSGGVPLSAVRLLLEQSDDAKPNSIDYSLNAVDNSTETLSARGTVYRIANADVNGVQFFAQSGNVTYDLYLLGRKKS